MVMPGCKYPAAGGVYRYGFNGKENDNEVKGEGNQQDYGMRIYDPRLMRFLSVDPISNDYPELTPYQFASNRPIDGIDQDGLEYAKANMHSDATIVRHNSDPHIAQEQIIAAPQRRNAVIAQDVQRKINTQARSVLTKYKEPDVAQKQRNASLQKNHDAKTVPENHWTRNKHLNNLSERVAEPMAEMAVGEGLGKVAIKGISALMKIGNEAKYLYHYTSPKSAESIMRTGFTITENRPFIYATNVSNLTGVQAKIELALPSYNPGTSIIRINATNLDAAIIRRVTGNLPGLSSGGGKEFIFNQNIPKSLLKQIK
jgi:RHS repeat-associated protein